MIRLILAEDHPIIRSGIKSVLESSGDISVVGEAVNGIAVLNLLSKPLKADIILMDISMPGMDGMTLLKNLKQSYPGICVIILSMIDNEKQVLEAFKFGAKGYLLKSTTVSELLFSIEQVAAGHRIICNDLAIKLLEKAPHISELVVPPISLSERETEILTLISEGFTNQEIADRVFSSRRTVEGHRQALVERAGVKNTAQLVMYACKNGLI